MASSISKKKKKKTDGKFFGKSQLKLSASILLFPESTSCQETSELMSINNLYDAYPSTQYLNMLLLKSMKTLNTGGGRKKIPVSAFFQWCNNSDRDMLCGTIVPYVIVRSHRVFHK